MVSSFFFIFFFSPHSELLLTFQEEIIPLTKSLLLSFNDDPLFNYFYPKGPKPGEMKEDFMKIHSRRLKEARINGTLIKLSTDIEGKNEDKFSGFAMIYTYPQRFSLAVFAQNLLFYSVNRLSPPSNEGQDMGRLETFFKLHDKYFDEAKARFNGNFVYLEVIAVVPTKQGLELGKKLMQYIMEFANERPMFLECTDISNVKFYQKYGFKVFGEELLDDDKTKITFMLKE